MLSHHGGAIIGGLTLHSVFGFDTDTTCNNPTAGQPDTTRPSRWGTEAVHASYSFCGPPGDSSCCRDSGCSVLAGDAVSADAGGGVCLAVWDSRHAHWMN